MRNIIIISMLLLCLAPSGAMANPGFSGSTGLITVPSAETLDAGNICVGAWSCYRENRNFSQKSSLVAPVSITLGIGTFWEVYGSYPNIIFNGEEDFSGHGTLDFGTKMRFLGIERSAPFKLAGDFLLQRHISENRAIDGATDLSARLIASYTKEAFGAHASAGYMMPDSVAGAPSDNGYTFGLGLEYTVMPRIRLLAEFAAESNRYYTESNPANSSLSMELTGGIQYYLTPHLTLNASAGTGLGKHDPDLTFLFGISSCQGVGSYVNPIPSVGRKAAVKDKSKDALKPLKIIPISSLLLKGTAAQTAPVSKLEVEVNANEEEVIIKPYGQIQIAPQQATSNLSAPVIPVEIPLKARDQEISLEPRKRDLEASAVDYTLNRIKGITPLYGVDVKGAQVDISSSAALPEKMVVYRKFSFPDVSFDFDQWSLSAEGKRMLSEAAEQIRNDKKWFFIRIDGHTDSVGSPEYNMDLSLKRAIAAATRLVSHEGIDPAKIFVKGFGKSAAIADNGTADGRRKNRRTEILLLISKDR